MSLKQYIEKCLAGEDLTIAEASSAVEVIMANGATDAEIAGLLIALRAKGESVAELVGFAQTMRRKSIRVAIQDPDAVDIVGTGGDGLGTFNISTVSAFVVAGAGVTVAKHGNKAVSSKSGSADTLSALGVNIHLPPVLAAECIDGVGVGFLFAPLFHPAMKSVAKVRADLGIRTIFNMLGPLTNPAGVKRQLVGTYNPVVSQKIAGALSHLDVGKACVVHSDDGMDEITITCSTTIIEVSAGRRTSTYSVSPKDFGFQAQSLSAVRGGGGEENARVALRVLNGERGPARDIVLANSAFGIYVAGRAGTIQEGQGMAAEAIDSGRALAKLRSLVAFTNRA